MAQREARRTEAQLAKEKVAAPHVLKSKKYRYAKREEGRAFFTCAEANVKYSSNFCFLPLFAFLFFFFTQ